MTKTETVPARFARLADELNGEHFERHEEVRCALLAMVSGATCFLLGEPGIAKSMLVRRLHARISGAEFFDLDMDRFTTPDDLFGPRSLRAMKEDRWERETAGTIITADFAFLDEFFEASSALVKTLLRTLNERTFRQGTEIIPMRLTTLFAASNEVPTEPRLAALYDRLLIRRKLSRIQDMGNFVSMLELSLEEKPEPVLSWADVAHAQVDARRVRIPDGLLLACGNIRSSLADNDIHPSDRRFASAMTVVRAAAWLDECTVADPEHLRCLVDILWAHPDQIPTVAAVVDAVLEPLVSEVDELLRAIEKIRRDIRLDLPEIARMELATELSENIELAERDFKVLKEQAKRPSARQRRQMQRCDVALKEVGMSIMRDLYLIDVSTLEAKRD